MSVTKKDIAEYLGISRSSVSFVLNNTPNVKVAEATRIQILQAAHELGYWTSEASPKLCFILHDREDIDPRYATNLKIISEAAEKYQHQLLFMSVKANPEDYLKLQKLLLEQKVAGLIVSGYLNDLFIDIIVETKIPCIFWGGTYREDVNIVMYDHKKAAYEATKYLLSLNHKDIAFFTGSLELLIHKWGLEGYKQALREAGLDVNKSLIQVSEEENGYEICRRMEELEIEYTAVFCVNSVIQFSALQRLKEKGVNVPNDVSLIGYEITELVKVSVPQLTVIHVELNEKATVVSRLMDIIRKEELEPEMILLSSLDMFKGGTVALCRKGTEA